RVGSVEPKTPRDGVMTDLQVSIWVESSPVAGRFCTRNSTPLAAELRRTGSSGTPSGGPRADGSSEGRSPRPRGGPTPWGAGRDLRLGRKESPMLFGNRRPRILDARRRIDGASTYRPEGESLEDKLLLAIDLGGTSPPSLPIIATAPFGMDFGGATAAQQAGTSVANVGDLNGDTYEDFAIGAPGGTSGLNSSVYVVLGSRTVNQTAITNWIGKNASTNTFIYTPNDRVGDLGQLGQNTQTNPITNTALDFPFPGITFISPANPQARLGASVAGIPLTNGQSALVIGAPGGFDANNANPGTGRVY